MSPKIKSRGRPSFPYPVADIWSAKGAGVMCAKHHMRSAHARPMFARCRICVCCVVLLCVASLWCAALWCCVGFEFVLLFVCSCVCLCFCVSVSAPLCLCARVSKFACLLVFCLLDNRMGAIQQLAVSAACRSPPGAEAVPQNEAERCEKLCLKAGVARSVRTCWC